MLHDRDVLIRPGPFHLVDGGDGEVLRADPGGAARVLRRMAAPTRLVMLRNCGQRGFTRTVPASPRAATSPAPDPGRASEWG